MTDREQFDSRVVPVMDRVRDELRQKQAEELRRYMRSPAYILAGGAGPDGGTISAGPPNMHQRSATLGTG